MRGALLIELQQGFSFEEAQAINGPDTQLFFFDLLA